MESCVSVRRKEVKSGKIVWKGSQINVDGDVVEGAVVCVGREDVFLALNEMKTNNRKCPWTFRSIIGVYCC